MCTEEFIRVMFRVDLYGNRGLDSRKCKLTYFLVQHCHCVVFPEVEAFHSRHCQQTHRRRRNQDQHHHLPKTF